MRTQAEWDTWYKEPDPWDYKGTDLDVLRVQRLTEQFRHAHFSHVLDVGCGEGWVTDVLSGMSDHTVGADISARAVERAHAHYPHIQFEQGDLLDVLKRPEILSIPFDLVVALEVLYYLQTDGERREAMASLAAQGIDKCLFHFSVIVTGSGADRRYFTHDEFLELAREHFNIIGWFQSVAKIPPALRFVSHIVGRKSGWVPLLDAWTRTRPPEMCQSVGYFALKR